MGTLERASQIVAALTSAGVRATSDPRNLQPPSVLVTPPRRIYDLVCDYSVEWSLVCIVPAPGTQDAWAALDDLIDATVEALELDPTVCDPAAYTLPDGQSSPAYIIKFQEVIPL